MFETVEVPILGLIENMSYFHCPCCQTRTDIFDHGGACRANEQQGFSILGEIPLAPSMRIGSDQGAPIVVTEPDSTLSEIFRDISRKLVVAIEIRHANRRTKPIIIK